MIIKSLTVTLVGSYSRSPQTRETIVLGSLHETIVATVYDILKTLDYIIFCHSLRILSIIACIIKVDTCKHCLGCLCGSTAVISCMPFLCRIVLYVLCRKLEVSEDLCICLVCSSLRHYILAWLCKKRNALEKTDEVKVLDCAEKTCLTFHSSSCLFRRRCIEVCRSLP